MSKIVIAVLLSFFISSIIGLILIPVIRSLKLGQNIREEGPKSHIQKSGIPTFGGIIFILATIISVLFLLKEYNEQVFWVVFAFVAFGLVGFIDDSLKKIHKKNEGLTSTQKMILLLIVSGILSYYAYNSSSIGSLIFIPFTGKLFNLGFLYIPFIIFCYTCTTNAANLTDGLDGLAATITLLIMIFFSLVCFSIGYYSLAIFCGCVSGALLGFLRFNSYPAKIIMGDTGSLALGGAVAAVAITIRNPLIIILVGGIYVIEILSVALQVVSFKVLGKRIFKMAPIHHSFELSGWHESKIVSLFSIITTILCLIAFLSF